jgi:hypothetical protein
MIILLLPAARLLLQLLEFEHGLLETDAINVEGSYSAPGLMWRSDFCDGEDPRNEDPFPLRCVWRRGSSRRGSSSQSTVFPIAFFLAYKCQLYCTAGDGAVQHSKDRFLVICSTRYAVHLGSLLVPRSTVPSRVDVPWGWQYRYRCLMTISATQNKAFLNILGLFSCFKHHGSRGEGGIDAVPWSGNMEPPWGPFLTSGNTTSQMFSNLDHNLWPHFFLPSARLTLHSTKLCTKFKISRKKNIFWY